jgi:glutamate-5-semialdehyde dehydrogenase
LEDDATFAPIKAANQADVAAASTAGRSTTRLELSDRMRANMVGGLRAWQALAGARDAVVETVPHDGWRVEQRRAPLGVVGFVFEGRPNVFADAAGVLAGGNTVVFRIGRDALGTARAITEHALAPALAEAGLPSGAMRLLDTPSRAAGWALFSEARLALAVARGSGGAVAQLGAVARQAGVPVSLHGTGGGWLVAGTGAGAKAFADAVFHSLDRKVCNTMNVCCIPADRADELVPVFLDALTRAGERRGAASKLHVAAGSEQRVPADWYERKVAVARAEGDVREAQAELLPVDQLGTEWEWEGSPEVSLVVTASVDEAVELCNRLSPKLVASLVSDDADEQQRFWASIDAPFVGNGFTRWVDGQFALGKPELGLSNWQGGRLFARSGVLTGDGVFTIRTKAIQARPDIHT